MSFFAWLDYSEHERRKMLDVIHLFSEQDTRDELGIGSVRDAFADLLFPGTTTIQTRASYFLYVPWLYQMLERQKVPSAQIAERARREEVALIKALSQSDDRAGTIGIDAKDKLKRLPSSVYWQGLGVWGIRRFPGSQSQYHRALDRYYTTHADRRRTEDGEWADGNVSPWHAGLPDPPEHFPQQITHRLRQLDAEYLHERILTAPQSRHSLLALLVDAGWEPTNVETPWQHPQARELPTAHREQLAHARNFADTIYGAALLYNLMLAEKRDRDDLRVRYRDQLQGWTAELAARGKAVTQWDQRRFWEIVTQGNARVTRLTRDFITAWLEYATQPAIAAGVADNTQARLLIHERERQLKRTLARLDNQRQLEQWQGDAGTGRLLFRWPVVQTILTDIQTGLTEGHGHA